MKQLLSVCAGPLSALMAALALCAPLHRTVDAGIDPATDYGEAMIDAAAAGDEEAGRAAEAARNEKIELLGLDEEEISYDLSLIHI